MNLPAGATGLGVGAALAAIMAGWDQVRNIFQRVVGVFITTLDLQGNCPRAVQIYCWNNLRTLPSPFKFYRGAIRYIKPLKRHGPVAYEVLGEKGRLFWKGWRPVWIQTHTNYSNRTIIRFIRFTFDPDDLVADILSSASSRMVENSSSQAQSSRFRVIRLAGMSGKDAWGMGSLDKSKSEAGKSGSPSIATPSDEDVLDGRLIGWGTNDIGEDVSDANPLDRLALTPEVVEVVDEIKRWYASKDWYLERQIPWRRGLLMYGQPGTGKSSLIKALAQYLKIPIYLFDISTMDNQEFHANYQKALADTPAIALIEDIDAVFHGRENLVAEKGQGLTYDCLLNTISGVESSDGLLFVVTTNNLEHVDPALGIPQQGYISSRPGRIDRAVELTMLDREGREKLASRIMTGCHESWIPYLVAKGARDTGAQFEERCATAALNLFWSEDTQQHAPVNGYHHKSPSAPMAMETVG